MPILLAKVHALPVRHALRYRPQQVLALWHLEMILASADVPGKRTAHVRDDVSRQIGRGIDQVEGDAGDTAASGIQHAADDFVCVRLADGSTRSGVTSHPARLVVRRRL